VRIAKLSLIFFLAAYPFFSTSQGSSKGANDQYLRERRKIFSKLKTWMENQHAGRIYPLQRLSRIPAEQASESKGIHLKGVISLAQNEAGGLILADTILNQVVVLDTSGAPLRSIGRAGQGPGELMQPSRAFCGAGLIYVFELGNMRVQTFEENGRARGGFRLYKTYSAIERAKSGQFYAIPAIRESQDTPLIDKLSEKGQLLNSFGTCLAFSSDLREKSLDNAASLSAGEGGELWVAFKHYPIVRMYASDGKLMSEFSIRHPIMADQSAINRRGEKIPTGQRAPARIVVTNAARYWNGKLYVLRTHPCLEIAEIDPRGEITGLYYWAEDFAYTSLDFLVVRRSGRIEFRVMNIKEQKVDIFN